MQPINGAFSASSSNSLGLQNRGGNVTVNAGGFPPWALAAAIAGAVVLGVLFLVRR